MTRATGVSPDRPRRENNFLQDRDAMRRGHFTGFPNFTQEDAAVSTSGGPIRDRSREMLSHADVAIARLYRSLLKSAQRSEEHTSELQSLMRNSYAVFCLKKKKNKKHKQTTL